MKSFIKLMIYVISIMMTMMTFVSSLVLGFRVIQLLWRSEINPTLCLECFGSFVLFGLFAACVKTLSPENITYSTGIKETLETLDHDSRHRETVGDLINSRDE
jgi:hypothetical protein